MEQAGITCEHAVINMQAENKRMLQAVQLNMSAASTTTAGLCLDEAGSPKSALQRHMSVL
jgi:hypothetical protein